MGYYLKNLKRHFIPIACRHVNNIDWFINCIRSHGISEIENNEEKNRRDERKLYWKILIEVLKSHNVSV